MIYLIKPHDNAMKTVDFYWKILPDPKKILPDQAIFGTGINLTNNEIKDILKIIKSLEKRGILLKGTNTKTTTQIRGFLNFLRSLMAAGLPLIKDVLTSLPKKVFIPLGLTAAAKRTYAAIQIKIYGSGTTGVIISNEEIEDITKRVKSLEESGLLIKGISQTTKNETKK